MRLVVVVFVIVFILHVHRYGLLPVYRETFLAYYMLSFVYWVIYNSKYINI